MTQRLRDMRLPCHLPSNTPSHWAMQATVTQENAAYGATSHCTRQQITCPEVSGWSDVGSPLEVGFALVGFGWPTVTTAVMAIINVIKITD